MLDLDFSSAELEKAVKTTPEVQEHIGVNLRRGTTAGVTSRPTNGGGYFAYIDGLRAVSIIAVVLYHLELPLLPSGFAGVDVFFVVSGFIISGSLHGRRFSGLGDLFATFYARRFRRIVPALLFMLIITCALVVLFVPQWSFASADLRQIASSAFFGVSNIRLAFGTNYFFPLAEFDPFTHTWSLAVEEQFYVIFPVIYLLLTTQRTANAALVGLVLLCICSFVYGWFEPRFAMNLGFYSSLGRFWEIGSGVLLYALFARSGRYRPEPSREIWLLSSAGALLLAAAFVVGAPQTYPVPGALLPVAGALCLITGLQGRTPTSLVGRALTAAPMVWIGFISYSLYLWHWPVFSLFRWTIGFTEVWQKLLALLIAIAMTLISYWAIEKPIRYAAWLQAPRRAIPVFLAAIALLWWGGDRIFGNAHNISLSVVTRNRDNWFGRPVIAQRAGECRVEARQLGPTGSPHIGLEPFDCGPPSAPKLFAIGDSHALGYQAMFSEYARRTGATVSLYSAPCGFPAFFLPRPECTAIDNAIIADVRAQAAPGDVIFLPSLRVPRFRDQWDAREHDTDAEWRAAEKSFDTASTKAIAMLQAVAPGDALIVFELPKPIFKIPLFRCADWFNRLNPACVGGSELDRAMLLDYRKPTLAFADALRSRVSGFSTWDPLPALCPGEVCSMWRDGSPLFFDGDHVTYFANMLLVDDFIAAMRNASSEVRRPRIDHNWVDEKRPGKG